MSTWLLRHIQALLGALGRLARSPLASIMTVFAIALALAMPLALKLLVDNLRLATGDFADAIDMTVYFKPDVKIDKVQQLASKARLKRGIDTVKVITAEDGLAEFRQYSGFGAALEALDENPLPNVLHVRPQTSYGTPVQMENLRRYFAAWPEVETVQIDNEWVQRFNSILGVLARLLVLGAVLLGLGVIAIVGNIVRLEILNRRAEIEVTKLVGGSNAFVRRPFLYIGALYGLIGAGLALAIIALGVGLIAGPANHLAELYGSGFRLVGPGPLELAALSLGALLLGLIGAWVSAGRQLAAIEPRA